MRVYKQEKKEKELEEKIIFWRGIAVFSTISFFILALILILVLLNIIG